MTSAQNDPLWESLSAFSFDQPGNKLTFAQRLARENGWSAAFTRRVLEEYRRFLFLAAKAGHPVTPSDEVDQAWHLHLVYTESYWNDLCRDVLGKPLHHGPTKGGRTEGDKFADWYGRTLDSYEKFFGQAPPADIWPPSERRFAPNQFCRVNKADWWMVSRANAGRTLRSAAVYLIGALMLGCGLVACTNSNDSVIPFLLILGVVAIVLIAKANRNKRGDGGGSGCSSSGGCGSSGCSSSGSTHGHSGCGSHHGGSGCGSDSGGGDGGGSSGCGSSCGGGGCGGGGD